MRGSSFSGGGGPGPTARIQSGCFFSPPTYLQFTEGVQWFYYGENYTFPRILRGSNIFQGGGGGGGRGSGPPPSGSAHENLVDYMMS